MNLENLGLVELNAQEVKETDGGIIPLLIVAGAIAIWAGIPVLGFYNGYNGQKR